MSDEAPPVGWQEKMAELERLLAEEKAKNKKPKKSKVKEEPPVDLEIEEVESDENKTKAIQTVKTEESTAITVKDISTELATIVQNNFVVPVVNWAKENPTTAVMVAGSSGLVGLIAANKAGLTDFNPLTLLGKVGEQIHQLGVDKTKKQLPAAKQSPDGEGFEEDGEGIDGPPTTIQNMRDVLLQRRAIKLGSNNEDLIPPEQYHLIDKNRYIVLNVSEYYKASDGITHKILLGHRQKPRGA